MISFQVEYLLVNCSAFKLDIRVLENKKIIGYTFMIL